MQEWCWSTPVQWRPKKTTLEEQEEQLQADGVAPPPGWYSAMPRSFLSLSSSREEMKSAVWTFSTSSIMGHFLAVPLLIVPHRSYRKICRTWPLGFWLWWRGEKVLATTNSQILENWVLNSNAKEVVPASGFICMAMTGELGCRSAWFRSLKHTKWLNASKKPHKIQWYAA